MTSAGSNGAVVRNRRGSGARSADHTPALEAGCIAGPDGGQMARPVTRNDAKERGVTERNAGNAREAPVESIEARQSAVVVHLCGELDLYTASELREAFAQLIGQAPERVVVDLGHVDFIDSTALAVLIEARTRLTDARAFLLAAPGIEPRRTLEIAGIAQHFGLYDTVEAALAAPI